MLCNILLEFSYTFYFQLIDARDNTENMALHLAVENRHKHVVQFLLQYGKFHLLSFNLFLYIFWLFIIYMLFATSPLIFH